MLTIKFRDKDSVEHIHEGRDIRAKLNGNKVTVVSWENDLGQRVIVVPPTVVRVQNSTGALVARYAVVGQIEQPAAAIEEPASVEPAPESAVPVEEPEAEV